MNPWGFHRMWGLGSHFRKTKWRGIFPVPVVDWGGGFKWLVVNLVTWERSKDCWEVLGTQLVDLTKIIKSINWHNTQGFPCIRWSSRLCRASSLILQPVQVSVLSKDIQGAPRLNEKKQIRNQLPNLQHLEGSVFSVLLRARSLVNLVMERMGRMGRMYKKKTGAQNGCEMPITLLDCSKLTLSWWKCLAC